MSLEGEPTRRSLARRAARRGLRELSRGAAFARWAVTDLVRAPGLELYAARQGRRTAHFVRESRRDGPAAQIAPFSGAGVPKTVWMYWAQGESGQPHIVRRCIASWRERNPGWEIRVLNDRAAAEAADLSDVPAGVPLHTRADVLRLRLAKCAPW